MVQINLDLQLSRVLYNNLIPQTLNFEYLKKKKTDPISIPENTRCSIYVSLQDSWVKGFFIHSPSEEIRAAHAFSDVMGEHL